MPSTSVLLPSSSTPFLHIHRSHHPSEHPTVTPHPTHTKVVLDTHPCHVKHPPAMQAPPQLTASPRASCTAGSNPAELLVAADSSAAARDQPFCSTPVPNPLPRASHIASRLPDNPTALQLGSLKALPGSGTPLPRGTGDLL